MTRANTKQETKFMFDPLQMCKLLLFLCLFEMQDTKATNNNNNKAI